MTQIRIQLKLVPNNSEKQPLVLSVKQAGDGYYHH